MIYFIFDLDDTLIFHQNNIHYNYIYENKELSYYLDSLKYPKYILTNGTRDHATTIVTNMKIKDKFISIYAREDTEPFNKPHPLCFQKITREISTSPSIVILFFDDLLENLQTAHKNKWITIWIHPNSHLSSQYDFIDYAFPNIITALIHFNKKTKSF